MIHRMLIALCLSIAIIGCEIPISTWDVRGSVDEIHDGGLGECRFDGFDAICLVPQPVEVIIEIEKPVEVIKTVEVPVEVETIVEVPVPGETIYIHVPGETHVVEVVTEVEVPHEEIVEIVKVVTEYVEVPVEVIKIVEKPVEVIKEVIKEVPVEVIKIVEKEVIKEIIKEVPVYQPFCIILERPTGITMDLGDGNGPVETVALERICFAGDGIPRLRIDKEVVEVPVEVIKEVIKEVPVEVIKEVIKEVPVEVIKEVIVEKEVIKEVIKEVEKIVKVPVEVEVIRYVDRVVEKIVEVPGPTVYVDRDVPFSGRIPLGDLGYSEDCYAIIVDGQFTEIVCASRTADTPPDPPPATARHSISLHWSDGWWILDVDYPVDFVPTFENTGISVTTSSGTVEGLTLGHPDADTPYWCAHISIDSDAQSMTVSVTFEGQTLTVSATR